MAGAIARDAECSGVLLQRAEDIKLCLFYARLVQTDFLPVQLKHERIVESHACLQLQAQCAYVLGAAMNTLCLQACIDFLKQEGLLWCHLPFELAAGFGNA